MSLFLYSNSLHAIEPSERWIVGDEASAKFQRNRVAVCGLVPGDAALPMPSLPLAFDANVRRTKFDRLVAYAVRSGSLRLSKGLSMVSR